MALMHVVEVRPPDELRTELQTVLGRFTEGSDSPLLARAEQVLAGQV